MLTIGNRWSLDRPRESHRLRRAPRFSDVSIGAHLPLRHLHIWSHSETEAVESRGDRRAGRPTPRAVRATARRHGGTREHPTEQRRRRRRIVACELKTRPDYAITVRNVLVGFVEVKAPAKAATRAGYRAARQGTMGEAASLPNLLYTDGNSFSLWQNGELVGSIVELRATSKRREPNSPPRRHCSRCSTTFFAGSRFRRAAPRNWPRSRRGSAACCATRSPNNWPRKAQPSPLSPPTGGSSSSPKRTINNSPTAMRRPSPSAC